MICWAEQKGGKSGSKSRRTVTGEHDGNDFCGYIYQAGKGAGWRGNQHGGQGECIESEIKNNHGSDVTKKQEELADVTQKAQAATASQMNTLAEANKVMEEAAAAERNENKTSGTKEEKHIGQKIQPKRQRKAVQTEKKHRIVYLASGHRQEMRRMYSGMTVHRRKMYSLLKQPFRKLQQHRQQFIPMWMCACRRWFYMSEINSFNDYASRYNTNMDYSTLFGGGAPYIDSGMGGINVSDYAMIKNGSYGKLMKAYYAKQDADKLSQTGDSSKTLTLMRSSADSLKKSAEALGNASLYEKEIQEKDEETGEETEVEDYDWDAITKAVKSFVDDYNAVVEQAGNSETKNVLRNAAWMTSITEKGRQSALKSRHHCRQRQ